MVDWYRWRVWIACTSEVVVLLQQGVEPVYPYLQLRLDRDQ